MADFCCGFSFYLVFLSNHIFPRGLQKQKMERERKKMEFSFLISPHEDMSVEGCLACSYLRTQCVNACVRDEQTMGILKRSQYCISIMPGRAAAILGMLFLKYFYHLQRFPLTPPTYSTWPSNHLAIGEQ